MISMNNQSYNRFEFEESSPTKTESNVETAVTAAVDNAMATVRKIAAEKPTVLVAVGLAVGVATGWFIKRK